MCRVTPKEQGVLEVSKHPSKLEPRDAYFWNSPHSEGVTKHKKWHNFFFLIIFLKKSYDTQLVVSIIGKIEKNYSGHFEKINKMLAPVWISFFTSIFSFKMLTSSSWPITLNPPHTLHKVTGVLICDYKEIMRVIRPVNFILFCGKKTANSSTLANLQQRIGIAIC